jgi:hypothetical protein
MHRDIVNLPRTALRRPAMVRQRLRLAACRAARDQTDEIRLGTCAGHRGYGRWRSVAPATCRNGGDSISFSQQTESGRAARSVVAADPGTAVPFAHCCCIACRAGASGRHIAAAALAIATRPQSLSHHALAENSSAAEPRSTGALAHSRSGRRRAADLSHFLRRGAARSPQNSPSNNTVVPLMQS